MRLPLCFLLVSLAATANVHAQPDQKASDPGKASDPDLADPDLGREAVGNPGQAGQTGPASGNMQVGSQQEAASREASQQAEVASQSSRNATKQSSRAEADAQADAQAGSESAGNAQAGPADEGIPTPHYAGHFAEPNPEVLEVNTVNAGLPPVSEPPYLATPRATLENLVDSCQTGDYLRAAHSLDLTLVASGERASVATSSRESCARCWSGGGRSTGRRLPTIRGASRATAIPAPGLERVPSYARTCSSPKSPWTTDLPSCDCSG